MVLALKVLSVRFDVGNLGAAHGTGVDERGLGESLGVLSTSALFSFLLLALVFLLGLDLLLTTCHCRRGLRTSPGRSRESVDKLVAQQFDSRVKRQKWPKRESCFSSTYQNGWWSGWTITLERRQRTQWNLFYQVRNALGSCGLCCS